MKACDINAMFAAEVRRRRKEKAWTIDELATRARLTTGFVGDVERGRRNPSISTAEAIAKGLGVPFTTLFGGEGLTAASMEAGRLFERLPRSLRSAVLTLIRGILEVKEDTP